MIHTVKDSSYKTDFTPFAVGSVFNNVREISRQLDHKLRQVRIKYPSRLEAMAIDPGKIVANKNLIYTPGQIDFGVKIFKTVTIRKSSPNEDINVSPTSKRASLIRHAAEIMRTALGTSDGLSIDVQDDVALRHCGLGSSSGLIASVACAINELYGNPISNRNLVKYLAQNHGEERDDDPNLITPVQCIGGSAACGTHDGGLVILAGENVVVKTMNVPEEYDVIIGIPNGFTYPDSKYLMEKEEENLPKFLETGRLYGPEIAYRLFHECLPDVAEGSIKKIGDLIFDYRWHMGSIDNCSFVYPPLIELTNAIAYLKSDGLADVLSVSSVGPGIFAITKYTDIVERAFQHNDMKTIRTKIHNGKYEVLEKN